MLDKAFEIIPDISQDPLFVRADTEKEFNVITQEMASVDHNPDDLVHKNVNYVVFSNQSTGSSLLDDFINLDKFKKQDIMSLK